MTLTTTSSGIHVVRIIVDKSSLKRVGRPRTRDLSGDFMKSLRRSTPVLTVKEIPRPVRGLTVARPSDIRDRRLAGVHRINRTQFWLWPVDVRPQRIDTSRDAEAQSGISMTELGLDRAATATAHAVTRRIPTRQDVSTRWGRGIIAKHWRRAEFDDYCGVIVDTGAYRPIETRLRLRR